MQLTIKVNSAGISRPVTNQSSVRYSGDLKRRYLVLTQEALAEALQEVGIDMERVTVAKLENGRRSFVTLDELLRLFRGAGDITSRSTRP